MLRNIEFQYKEKSQLHLEIGIDSKFYKRKPLKIYLKSFTASLRSKTLIPVNCLSTMLLPAADR